jgi:DNA-directed RNA polymerase sigma subunit (sigma70/sigma32)
MLRALAAQRKSQGREKFTRERETSAGPVSVEARPTLVSFDACLGPDATSTWSDVLPDEAGIPADQVVLGAEMRHAVSAALDSLIDRDAAILRSYFGLDGGGAFSVREIARRMGLATSDVSRRIQAALTHLRCSTEGRALLEFVA